MTTETSEPLSHAADVQFKPYPACKDSGVRWLGQIPSHWSVRKWRYCCHLTQGQVPPDDDRYRDRIMIAPNHVESGTGRILFTESADEQGATSGKYLVKPGDIIYSKIRPALNKACIAAGHWLCSADMYAVAVSTDDLVPKFLLYFILSEPFVRLMVDESMRVAMSKVNRETVADCSLLIPPLTEQERIVRYLDRETARIDGLVAKKERLIELLQEKRAALITRAVTTGLDPGVPTKDSGVDWMGAVPSH
jgi:type I restriction enzyme, S subunit